MYSLAAVDHVVVWCFLSFAVSPGTWLGVLLRCAKIGKKEEREREGKHNVDDGVMMMMR